MIIFLYIAAHFCPLGNPKQQLIVLTIYIPLLPSPFSHPPLSLPLPFLSPFPSPSPLPPPSPFSHPPLSLPPPFSLTLSFSLPSPSPLPFLSPTLPQPECFTPGCGYDGGEGECFFKPDVEDPWANCTEAAFCKPRFNNGHCDVQCNVRECIYDAQECVPARECPIE